MSSLLECANCLLFYWHLKRMLDMNILFCLSVLYVEIGGHVNLGSLQNTIDSELFSHVACWRKEKCIIGFTHSIYLHLYFSLRILYMTPSIDLRLSTSDQFYLPTDVVVSIH